MRAVGLGGSIGIAVPTGELLMAPVVVGVPVNGPWLVAPVKVSTTGGRAFVAPGMSAAGIPAYDAADETAALFTVPTSLYEYVPYGKSVTVASSSKA